MTWRTGTHRKDRKYFRGPESPGLACFMTSGGGRAELWGLVLRSRACHHAGEGWCKARQSSPDREAKALLLSTLLPLCAQNGSHGCRRSKAARVTMTLTVTVTVRKCVSQIPPSSKEVPSLFSNHHTHRLRPGTHREGDRELQETAGARFLPLPGLLSPKAPSPPSPAGSRAASPGRGSGCVEVWSPDLFGSHFLKGRDSCGMMM